MSDATGAAGTGQASGEAAATQTTTTTEGQQTQAQTTQQQAAASTAQQAAAGDQAQAVTPATDAELAQRYPGFEAWPEEARAAIRARDKDARSYQREAGNNRIAAREDARQAGASEATLKLAREVFGALGVDLPGEAAQVTPEQLAQQVQGVTGERDAARLETLTIRQAVPAGVDPAKLDYLAFKLGQSAEYRAIDPTASDAGDKVRASIDAALAQDATLRLTGTVQVSGVENLGGSAGADAITPEKFSNMSITDRQELYFSDRPLYDRLVAAQR